MSFEYGNVTVGADPELFLVNKIGKFISSIGIIGGSKDTPKPISTNGHAIQEDNVAIEFNIPPADNAFKFVEDIDYVLSHIKENYTKPLNLELAIVPSAVFATDQLNNEKAQTFGCDPDFNAYSLQENPKPVAGHGGSLRTAGGHIHVGYTDPSMLDNAICIRAMDVTLGVPSVLIDPDTERRSMYGKAGAFRHKTYGVEYRTLSNFWIKSKELSQWVFEQTLKAIEIARDPEFRKLLMSDNFTDRVQNIINNSDTRGAKALMAEYKLGV